MYRAKVSSVPFGSNLSIEGLLMEGGSYGVGIPQVAHLYSVPQKNSARDLKALLGLDSPCLKVATELNSKKIDVLTLAKPQPQSKGQRLFLLGSRWEAVDDLGSAVVN